MKMISIFIFLICVNKACFAIDLYEVSKGEAIKFTEHCSRNNIKNESSEWAIKQRYFGDIKSAIENIDTKKYNINDITSYIFQIGGLIINGKKYVYINAIDNHILKTSNDENLKNAIIVCDGGNYFWGALYDTKSKTLTDISVNGMI